MKSQLNVGFFVIIKILLEAIVNNTIIAIVIGYD